MLSFDLPYPSRRAPVAAEQLVATSQPLATQAGIEALRRGGNAIDAVLAAAITLTVVEPSNNGLGSDAFALLWDGERLHGLNASGRAPAAMTPDRYAGREHMPLHGWDAVTVPGAVSAWAVLSERFGQLPFAELFTAARHYAEHGFLVGPETAWGWAEAERSLAAQPGFADHFLPAPQAGTRVRRPDLARTLERLAGRGADDFYQGELAQRIADAAQDAGGPLALSDLANHEPDWVDPLTLSYRDREVHEIPPNGQGLATLIALGILRELPATDPDSAAGVHVQLEAMKIAIRAAFAHIADPQAMRVEPAALLASESLQRAAASIGPKASALPPMALPPSSDTVYLCAADADGRMVSFIQSNYLGFGSGVVVPGTGIALQNRAAGFVLEPGHPNRVGPGKRPYHTIIPGFVTEAAEPRLAFGVMGGHMQHQGHVQMINRIFEHGQNPQAAADAPRWLVEPDFSVSLEQGFPVGVAAELAARGHQLRQDHHYRNFGGAQLILRVDGGYVGASDPRKEGQVSGF
ncbi:MAG: gamma-glutamyltransferase family protein [Pseudomonadota bacterium]